MSDRTDVVILGGGVGGLSAGWFLQRTGAYNVTVLEKDAVVGGVCGSFCRDGFTLDYGAHKLYSVIPGVMDEIAELMGDRLTTLPKSNRLFLRGHRVDYPLRLGNLAAALGLGVFLKLGFGYAWQLATGPLKRSEARSYEQYIVRRFGRPAYELVFEPLADKVWGDPAGLHPDMARTRVPASGGLEVVLKLLGLKKDTAQTNAERFWYPKAGFGDFPKAMAERIEQDGGRVLCDANVREAVRDGATVKEVRATVAGRDETYPCDVLISSIPLADLGSLVFADDGGEFASLIERLQYRHVVMAFLTIDRPNVLTDQWVFFPERKYLFSRIFEQKRMIAELCPADRTVLCCDFTCESDSWAWRASDEQIAERCAEGLVEAGFIKPEEVSDTVVKRRESFYPRYDLAYREKIAAVMDKIKSVRNLVPTGRVGLYNYNNADHCVDMGRFISERLNPAAATADLVDPLQQRVSEYRIVD